MCVYIYIYIICVCIYIYVYIYVYELAAAGRVEAEGKLSGALEDLGAAKAQVRHLVYLLYYALPVQQYRY